MCPNKIAGCRAFLVVTVGVAPLDFKGCFSVCIGFIQMWNGKGGYTAVVTGNLTQWLTDRKRAVGSSSHPLECTPVCESTAICVSCVWLLGCVHWCGSVSRWLRRAPLSAGKFLSLQPQLHMSMQERTFETGEVPLRTQAYVFVHIAQHEPGEQVVSH